ncbi:MAG: WecB/TagA/CpsF family glycosyltransferase [Planctomycetes bacterium]|nr:WecB/TagA/CpsF family glycosyltransferase [Planctomycetota bacterium]
MAELLVYQSVTAPEPAMEKPELTFSSSVVPVSNPAAPLAQNEWFALSGSPTLPAGKPGVEDHATKPLWSLPLPASARRFRVLDVSMLDMTFDDALALCEWLVLNPGDQPHTLYYANAHTLNLAYEEPSFREVLNRATVVLGDGTGVRWAARMQGVRVQANLNGTDLVPEFLEVTSGKRFGYYLLGSTPEIVARSAAVAAEMFPGWTQCGFHAGFLSEANESAVIDEINRVRPHLLLVAMGNPIQEKWIDRNRSRLNARLCMGVGALVDRWAGELIRAPLWVRKLGMEWADILRRQPHKWQRYVLGNPKYLWRIVQERCRQICTRGC